MHDETEDSTLETEDSFYIHRLENGLFTLQTVDYILAWLMMEDDGVRLVNLLLFMSLINVDSGPCLSHVISRKSINARYRADAAHISRTCWYRWCQWINASSVPERHFTRTYSCIRHCKPNIKDRAMPLFSDSEHLQDDTSRGFQNRRRQNHG